MTEHVLLTLDLIILFGNIIAIYEYIKFRKELKEK